MYDIIWIIPHLNEDFNILTKNIKMFIKYSEEKKLRSLISILDNGSNYSLLYRIKNFCQLKSNSGFCKVKLNLCLPPIRPAKNKGILDVIKSDHSKAIIIIDSDCANLKKKYIDSLVNPLLSNEAKITIPDIAKTGGRVGRLVVNPLLRLLFPEIGYTIPYPVGGVLGIDYECLKNSIFSNDYFWTWEGEVQIIIRGFKNSKGKIKVFKFLKRDAKKNSIKSKYIHALSFARGLIYEGLINNRIEQKIVKHNLVKAWKNRKLVKLFRNWEIRNNLEFFGPNFDIERIFEELLKKCEEDIFWIPKYLNNMYNSTGIYEIFLLNYLSVKSILNVLFGLDFQIEPIDIDSSRIDNLRLLDISILADLFFAVYITLWLKKNKNKKYIEHFLNEIKNQLRVMKTNENKLDSVEITNWNVKKLKNVITIYNSDKLDVYEKSRMLKELL
jgi:hypothetical protein